MRLFDPPGAGFDHPLEILDGCHQRIRRFSELAVKIAHQVQASGVDDDVREAARSVVRYFDDAGAKHHRDEEDDLFPALDRSIAPAERPALSALVEKLRADHEENDRLWAAVRTSLQSMAERGEGTLDPAIAEAFAQAYRSHIALEERELLPLAGRVLPADSIASLGRSMAARRGVTPKRA